MSASLRFLARWVLSTLIVSVPLAWLLWNWRWSRDKVLPGMSYDRFSAALSDQSPPVVWTYVLWVSLLTGVVVTLVHVIAGALARVFPVQVLREK